MEDLGESGEKRDGEREKKIVERERERKIDSRERVRKKERETEGER